MREAEAVPLRLRRMASAASWYSDVTVAPSSAADSALTVIFPA